MKKIFSLFLTVFFACALSAQESSYPAHMYLIGDASPAGWSLDARVSMLTVEEGLYEWVGDLSAGELKFLTANDWLPSYGPTTSGTALAIGELTLVVRTDYEQVDSKFAVTAGRYSLTVDLRGENLLLTVADGAGKESTIVYPDYMYPIGEATSWNWSLDDAQPMSPTAFNSGIYVAEIALEAGSLKFLSDNTNWLPSFGPEENGAALAAGDQNLLKRTSYDESDNLFAVSAAGTYTLTIDLTQATPVLKVEQGGESAIELVDAHMPVDVYDIFGNKILEHVELMHIRSYALPKGMYILQHDRLSRKILL